MTPNSTQSPPYILHIDNGIIDQRTDGNGHTSDGHSIDRKIHESQRKDRDKQCQWNGDQRDKRGAPVHQEDEKHQDDKDGSLYERVLDIADT